MTLRVKEEKVLSQTEVGTKQGSDFDHMAKMLEAPMLFFFVSELGKIFCAKMFESLF